jgi:hypothetical protein
MNSFGIEGAFYLDVILTSLVLPISFLILRELGINRLGATLSSIVFLLTLTGQFGEPIRTQLLAIFLTLVAIYLGLKSHWIASGAITTLVFFSKLPIVIIPGLVILAICFLSGKLKELYKYFTAIVITFLGFFLLMIIRGEFKGYLEMLAENFRYASTYQGIIGQAPGVQGHFLAWNGENQRALIFFIVLFYIIAIFRGNLRNRLFIVTISVNIGVATFLLFTAMWPHHLQILSLSVLFNLATMIHVFETLNTQDRSKVQDDKRFLFKPLSQKSIHILIFLSILFPVVSGAQISAVPQMSMQSWNNPRWIMPPELRMLQAVDNNSKQIEFARLGVNDDLAFGAFLENNFKMVCMRHGLTGAESLTSMDKYLTCLRDKPNVILIAPFYSALKSRQGNYQYYYLESQKILQSYFQCEKWENSEYQLCKRN